MMRLSMRGAKWRAIGLAVAAGVALPIGARGQSSARTSAFPDSVAALFKALAGHWSCNGGFPHGGALAADLTFTPVAGDYAIDFRHVDRAPGIYWQNSTWAFDGKSGRVVSTGMSGSQKDRAGAASMFTASRWSPTSITLDADTVKAPPFAPNRFTYAVGGGSTLTMRWEVERNGAWALGDSLVCGRTG
jgi:hypothetical protein